EVSDGSRPVMMRTMAVSAALLIRIVVWPYRSTHRPRSGDETAPQIAYPPLTAPATANEPVSRWAWTSRPMVNIARGRRATTELPSSDRAPGAERIEVRSRVLVITRDRRPKVAHL